MVNGTGQVTYLTSKPYGEMKNLSTGSYPYAVAYDPANGYMYVANGGTNNVSPVPPVYSVTFSEKGIPDGTMWGIILNGDITHSTSNSSITFGLPDGNYSLSVPSLGSYQSTNYSTTFLVEGKNMSESIYFKPYPATLFSSLDGMTWGLIAAILVWSITAAMWGRRRNHN